MKCYVLGEFEEIVLLAIAILHKEAYGFAIKTEIETRLNREVSMGALHTALLRLEDKGYVRTADENLLTISSHALVHSGSSLSQAERRSKEIGIRKVLGASVSDVSFMLVKEFIVLLFIASAIAWPVSWYL